ncbi:hypothetical protein H8S18_07945 [Christensenella sp. NSJ-35]|uniref:Uncharacterized protein n=1 Tax=Christensenella tenuis TaxID=2763033 RepID=A0ABR7EEP7_9FIRM|nr:hypothetical protein [Christensenella tenuis]
MGARGGNAISAQRERSGEGFPAKPSGAGFRNGKRSNYDDAGQLEQWRRWLHEKKRAYEPRTDAGREKAAGIQNRANRGEAADTGREGYYKPFR